MRSLAILLCAFYLSLSVTVKAEDHSDFYDWAEKIVVKSEMTGGVINNTQTLIIRVTNDWNNEKISTPTFQLWLPSYVSCTIHRQDMEQARLRGTETFVVHVILADPNTEITARVSGWVPFDACNETMKRIDEYVYPD